MTEPPAVIRNYDDLIEVMKARADVIGVSMQVLDELAGLPSGYSGKLFGPGQVKTMGLQSLFLLAETLGYSVALVLDLDAVKRMESRWEQRDELRRRPDKMRLGEKARRRIMKEMGRLGGKTQKRFRIDEKRRSAINRRNAKQGWKTRRNNQNHTSQAAGHAASNS